MRLFATACLATLLVAGCTTTDKVAIVTCSGYAVSLNVLADFKKQGKLTAQDIAAVDRARGVLNPICEQEKLPALDAQTASNVTDAITQINNIIKGK